jgi:predicted phage baseplate assembly protein
VGAEALAHIVSSETAIVEVRNPLPAWGGVEPETIEQVRQNAPSAFRTQERAVTADDYAEVTGLHSQVQRAAATFRWTGSWHTVFLTVDRLGGQEVEATFEEDILRHVERFRMAGHDVEVDGPRFVPLEIEMYVCVHPNYFRSDVKAALLEVFSNRPLPDGRRGVFHPDNFTFGQPVYLSTLYAAAQAVTGVASVRIKTFQRQDSPSNEALEKGELTLGRLEIARLDNDPNFPKHGVFRVTLEGGK